VELFTESNKAKAQIEIFFWGDYLLTEF